MGPLSQSEISISCSEKDKSSRQKICRGTVKLNTSISELGVIDIHRLLLPKAAEYTFFSNSKGAFSKTAHTLSQIRLIPKGVDVERSSCHCYGRHYYF